MRQVAMEFYPDAKRIVVVLDNLNTHAIASFYETFPAKVAFELGQRFEFHFTPKHGSWLNIAETELSALNIQCVGNRRLDNLDYLNEELTAWYTQRNAKEVKVNWQFETQDARIKLKQLYPIPVFGK